MELNILLTSVGRRSYLVDYFKDALKGRGLVHAANSDMYSPAFQRADRTVVTPLIYDKEYIPFLVKYCINNAISAIISLFDVDLPILSRNKEVFSEIGTKIIVSDYNIIDICNDKWKTYCYLQEQKFRVPLTFLDLNEVTDALENARIHFPLIIKPRWGMGSIGIFETENMDELQVLYQYAYKKIMNSYLKYETGLNSRKAVLIQEKVSGQEFGLDVINNLRGDYITTIVKKKCAMRSGETDCAMTVNSPELKNTGSRLGSLLRHVANLDVDAFIKEDGGVVILEMNARFGGGYPFSHVSGVNLPEAIVSWLLGEESDERFFRERYGVMAQKDIRMVRL